MKNYDADLQMIIEPSRPVKLHRLAFERHILETGRGEHDVAGPPSGPLVGEPEHLEVAA